MGNLGHSPDVQSFYALTDVDLSKAVCQGAACFVARGLNPDRWRQAETQSPRVYCLGKCYAAPAAGTDDTRPRIEVRSRTAIVFGRLAVGETHELDEYRRQGGLKGLERALKLGSERTIAELEASELRGRGGAGFPTGAKWRTAAKQDSRDKYVVANFDEGDPGAYIDRFIAEDDPYYLIEGMAIAAFAIGASKGWIYARCEYPRAIERLKSALTSARAFGLLGPKVLGTDFHFDIELVIGRGSYECGEETSLLNSIEGMRPVARVRPPYVADCGLWGMPTVVNNVETLSNVVWILENGAASFASLGVPGSRGTKVLSLNSLFRRPGLYEVEFGTTLRSIVEDFGGGLASGKLHGLWIGGPLAGVIPSSLLDTPLGFQELREIGGSVGHGGVIAFNEQTTIPQLVHHVFSFGAYESCGKCTPCRLGAPRIEQLFAPLINGGRREQSEPTEWQEIVTALKLASLCGLGTGLAEFAESILRHYSEELNACFA
jgi:NADH:ubiquinone oxidoreductase subunit F (NADH-binding)